MDKNTNHDKNLSECQNVTKKLTTKPNTKQIVCSVAAFLPLT